MPETPRPARRKAYETMTDLGTLGSVIIVLAWVLRTFGGIEMPADVQLNLGVVLMVAGAGLSRWWRHRRLYGRGR